MLSPARLAIVVTTVAVGLSGVPAAAHAHLVAASPGAATIVAAPTAIRLRFNEALLAPFSGVALRDATGRSVPLRAVVLSADGKQLTAIVKSRLARGNYVIKWHAVASDTHRVEGSSHFTVR